MTSKSRKRPAAVRRPDKDVYRRITDKIVEQLEAGVRPWHQPWGANGSATRPLRHNGIPYRGINTVLLWMETAANGYASPFWMTYRQAQEIGGQVRKGEKSTLVVYAGAIEKTEEDDQGEEIEHRIPVLKGYCVFNCDQIDCPNTSVQPWRHRNQRSASRLPMPSSPTPALRSASVATRPSTPSPTTISACRPSRRSNRLNPTPRRSPTGALDSPSLTPRP
jgi:antirestriction protein ArdC